MPPAVIGEAEATAVFPGDKRSLERGNDLARVAVGDREGWYFEDHRRRRAREALGVRGRADARGQRIAGIGRHILDRAALNAGLGPTTAAWIDVRFCVAVVRRIGIDEAADGAMFLRQLRLQTAPAAAVPRKYNLAAHVDAALRKRVIIVRHSVVHVHHGRGDVAVALEGDVGRKRAFEMRRGWILRDRGLLTPERDVLRCHELERCRDRRRVEHVEALDVRIHPHCLNSASCMSALALSCGEPT